MTELLTVRDSVRGYYESWIKGDISRARTYLADGLDFQGPIDRFSSAGEYSRALAGFASMLARAAGILCG